MSRNGSGVYSRVPGSSYQNGTTADGPELDAEMNDIATELTNSLARDGQSAPTANLPMGGFRHTGAGNGVARTDYATVGQVQDGSTVVLGTLGGTANAITAVTTPSFTGYQPGHSFRFVPSANNTGATTININGLGAKNVFARGAAMIGGELNSGHPVELYYDGIQFQVISPMASIDSPRFLSILLMNASSVTATTPLLTHLFAGLTFRFIATATNTGAMTLDVNSTGAKAIKNRGAALRGWEIVTGQFVEVVYDGTDYHLTSPVPTRVLLKKQTASNSASLILNDLSVTSWEYFEIVGSITPALTNENLTSQWSTNNGSSFITAGGSYAFSGIGQSTVTGAWSAHTYSDSAAQIYLSPGIGNVSPTTFRGTFHYGTSGGCYWMLETTHWTVGGVLFANKWMAYGPSSTNALKFYMSLGNIASGFVEIYGCR